MKTETELDQDILAITMKIQREYPELSKHIGEMPVKISEKDNEKTNISDLEDYYNSLDELLNDYRMTHKPSNKNLVTFPPNVNHNPFDHLPKNSTYKKIKEEKDIDPEDITKKKTPNEKPGMANEKSFEEDRSGSDLDVPGSELDDQQESVGSEDEENNYYSLGGDNHDD